LKEVTLETAAMLLAGLKRGFTKSGSHSKNSFWVLAALSVTILLAAYLRLGAVLQTIYEVPLRADALDYVSYAYNLREFGVYSKEPSFLVPAKIPKPDALRTPGYPVFLTIFMGEGHGSKFILTIGLVQTLLGLISIGLIWSLSREVSGDAWALIPAVILAISPHHVNFAGLILTETVFTFVIFVSLVVARYAIKHRTSGLLLGLGGLIAISILIRPTLIHLMVVALPIFAISPHLKPTRRLFGMAFLGWITVMSPWLIRNQMSSNELQTGRLAISSINHGSYPDFRYKDLPESQDFPYRFDPQSEEATRNLRTVVQSVAEKFEEQPGKMLRWYLLGKPLSFFGWRLGQSKEDVFQYPVLASPYDHNRIFQLTRSVAEFCHPIVVILGIFGLCMSWSKSAFDAVGRNAIIWLRCVSLLIVYLVGVHIVAAPFGRYSVPFIPIISIASMFALRIVAVWVRSQLRKRQ